MLFLSKGRSTAGTRRATGLACALSAAFCLIALAPAGALAAPEELWTSCDSASPEGQRCANPRGVAANPVTGRIFVGDNFNSRVVELDPLGTLTRAWGWDVVASGPGETAGDEFEICVPEEGDACQSGASGSGAGQFGAVHGVALDSAGAVYVVDRGNRRVQKFDRKGDFLLTFGGEVNKTKVDEGTASEAEENLCTAASGDECKAGVQGTGEGQFGSWGVGSFIDVDTKGTATDADDEVYVGDRERIQIFDAEGNYLEDWPDSEGALTGETVTSLALDSAANIYVTYFNKEDVRKLTPGGEELATPRFEIPSLGISAERPLFPTAVAVNGEGHVFAFCCPNRTPGTPTPEDPIFEFDSSGNVVDQFGKGEFDSSNGLATNLCAGSEEPGNLYVTNRGGPGDFVRAYGTEPVGCFKARTLPATEVEETSATLNGTINPDGALPEDCEFEYGTTTEYGSSIDCAEDEATEIGAGTEPVPVHAELSALAPATTYHFRLRAKIGGEVQNGPDESFKTKGPPVISDEHAVAVTESEALVRARVNPEGLQTSCHVAYGSGEALDRSSAPSEVGEDRSEHTVTAALTGLDPSTTYRWRFVCENSAAFEAGIAEGKVLELTTHSSFAADTDCPNQSLRGGASAFLPDCRAYELVSPVDKNGADIVAGTVPEGEDVASFVQSAPGGAKITYAAKFPAFADPERSFYFNQYLADRGGGGWSTEAVLPPYTGEAVAGIPIGISRELMAFTPDLCSAWMIDWQTPALFEGRDEAANLLRRDNCAPGKGSFETLTDVPVPLEGEPRSRYVNQFSVQGRSEDGRHAVFRAKAALNEDANEGTNAQLYDRFGGELHLVSVLPNGKADATETAVGSGWEGSLENAVSEDGSVVYWTSDIGFGTTGKLFARLDPELGIVAGECEGGAPCRTVAVSKGATNSFFHNAVFWAGSPDGSRALYTEEAEGQEDLYRFELASKESEPVAEDVIGVLGASDDLARIYLVSRDVLPDSGENSEEEEAIEGEPNLYLLEGGEASFIATLAEGDVGQREPDTFHLPYNLVARNTKLRATRTSPDGQTLAFQSRAPITKFDNSAAGGSAAVEVYRYQAGADQLHCISCNPAGARPVTRELSRPFVASGRVRTDVHAAAWIPTWEQPTHATNVLSADGNRLFFNSNDPLLPRDANGAQDVYEWEAAGTGSCEASDPSFFADNGGCLYLISSGQSPFESTFWEADADGSDVFFTTESSLLPQDPGLIDLYDARVGGGFPQPVEQSECEGEACQSPPPPPQFDLPASSAYNGPPNLTPQRNCRGQAQRARRLSRRAKAARRAVRGARRQGNARKARRMRRTTRRSARGARKMSNKAKRCRAANRKGRAGR